MIILGIDPGSHVTGYGVVATGELLQVVKTGVGYVAVGVATACAQWVALGQFGIGLEEVVAVFQRADVQATNTARQFDAGAFCAFNRLQRAIDVALLSPRQAQNTRPL